MKNNIKIYDCFPFFNELDLLEIRFNELYEHVDYFVLCESTITHSGKKKPLYYKENKERYKKWNDKVIHLVYDPKKLSVSFGLFNWLSNFNFMKNKIMGRIYAIFGFGRWEIEHAQRNYLLNGFNNTKENDIIILSDVDEIINPKKIKNVREFLKNNPKKILALDQKLYYYFLNGLSNSSWASAKALVYKKLVFMKKPDWVRNWTPTERIVGPLFKVWQAKKREVLLKGGGWHFSYVGGRDFVKNKIKNISHYEIDSKEKNDDMINEFLEKGQHLTDKNIKIKYVKIDRNFPESIQKNKKKYSHLIK